MIRYVFEVSAEGLNPGIYFDSISVNVAGVFNNPLLHVIQLAVTNNDDTLTSSSNPQLLQNYPNPFNPVTNINFSLSQSSTVKFEIFNINGQLIETLIDRYLEAGEHTVSWDGNRYASGIYLYRLATEDKIVTKKNDFT